MTSGNEVLGHEVTSAEDYCGCANDRDREGRRKSPSTEADAMKRITVALERIADSLEVMSNGGKI